MLGIIIDHINQRIKTLNQFSKLYGLAEIVSRENSSNPAVYCGNGNYEHIELDKYEGLVYHRKNGKITREDSDLKLQACDKIIIMTYPMLLIGFAKKDILNTDDAFIADKLCENIADVITFENDRTLSSDLRALRNDSSVKAYDTDHARILKQEYSETKYNDLNFNYALFQIEYEVKITLTQSCYEVWCKNDVRTATAICEPVTIFESDGTTVAETVECGGSYTLEDCDDNPEYDVCIDYAAIPLTAIETGGVWTGTGVSFSGGVYYFTPADAGVGTYDITYTKGAKSWTYTVTVNPLPTVTLAPFSDVLVTDPPFNLTGGLPLGGTYSGNGITTSPLFDPAAADRGTHEIFYQYFDENGCQAFAMQTITVL